MRPQGHLSVWSGLRPLRWGASFVLLTMFVLATPPVVVLSGDSVGSFEIDGDLVDDSGPGEPIDWATPPPNVTLFADKSGQTDDIFGMGSKELEQSGWICKTGSAPGKADIVSGRIAFRVVDGKQYLYGSFFRKETNGDVHMDYEFNQLTGLNSDASPSCPTLPLRTPGDIAITFDTELGGKTINVRAFMWDGATFNETSLGPRGIFWDAAVNIPNEIPGVSPGAFGEFALNLTDTVGDIGCGKFNGIYMKTRSSHSITSELFDRTPPQALAPVVPPPDLSKAKANGNAFAAHVADTQHDGLHADIDVTFPNGVNPAGGVRSSQTGPGTSSQTDAVLSVNQPGMIQARVLSASSASTVTAEPASAINTAIAEVADINVLDGLLTAGMVTAVAETTASGTESSLSAGGSAFQDLLIDPDGAAGPLPPVAYDNVNPNTTVELPAAIFGSGSFIKLFERVGSTSTPPPGNTPGVFTADLSVRMINVHITDHDPLMLGTQTVDVVVASAVSHAEFEQIIICPPNRVSGHAFIVKESTSPALTPAVVGFVDIPANGGLDQQSLERVIVPADGSALTSGVSVSESFGMLFTEGTVASSFAETSGACVLSAGGLCQVSATVIRSQSNSMGDPAGALSNADGTQLLQATVLGSDVCTMLGLDATCTPPPNTTIPLAGLGFVVLNEQFCDNNGTLANRCADGAVAGHAGLTVRAIRIVVTAPNNPLGLALGTEIIVSQAHSDAEFRTR